MSGIRMDCYWVGPTVGSDEGVQPIESAGVGNADHGVGLVMVEEGEALACIEWRPDGFHIFFPGDIRPPVHMHPDWVPWKD